MLANEAKFLGVEYMAVRWALTVTAIFLMAFITGIFVKKKICPNTRLLMIVAVVKNNYKY